MMPVPGPVLIYSIPYFWIAKSVANNKNYPNVTSRIEQTKKIAFLTVLPKVSEQVSTTFGNIPSSSLRGVNLSAIGPIPARS